MSAPGPPVLLLWEKIIDELMQRTASFPRHIRNSLAIRLEVLALDIYERLIESRYARKPRAMLERANLDLEKMRLLLRLSYRRRAISEKGLRVLIGGIDEAGQMIGGWLCYEQRKVKGSKVSGDSQR